MRCFVALDLPAPVLNHLANLTRPLRDRYPVRWVEPDQMHATLLFADDIAEETADELADIVHSVALAPLSLRLQHLGHFPPSGVPRVLWAALGGDIDALTDLHDRIAARAQPLGIDPDPRGFTPHVTLGRVKSAFGALALIDGLRALGKDLKQKPFAPIALSLYTSELRPGGAIYELLTSRDFPIDEPPLD